MQVLCIQVECWKYFHCSFAFKVINIFERKKKNVEKQKFTWMQNCLVCVLFPEFRFPLEIAEFNLQKKMFRYSDDDDNEFQMNCLKITSMKFGSSIFVRLFWISFFPSRQIISRWILSYKQFKLMLKHVSVITFNQKLIYKTRKISIEIDLIHEWK